MATLPVRSRRTRSKPALLNEDLVRELVVECSKGWGGVGRMSHARCRAGPPAGAERTTRELCRVRSRGRAGPSGRRPPVCRRPGGRLPACSFNKGLPCCPSARHLRSETLSEPLHRPLSGGPGQRVGVRLLDVVRDAQPTRDGRDVSPSSSVAASLAPWVTTPPPPGLRTRARSTPRQASDEGSPPIPAQLHRAGGGCSSQNLLDNCVEILAC